MTLTLADSSVTQPLVVHDTKRDSRGSIILGRPFLATGKANIDMETGELVLKFNKETMVFKVYDWTPYVEDLDICCHLEEKGSKVDKEKETSELTYVRVSLVPDVPWAWTIKLMAENKCLMGGNPSVRIYFILHSILVFNHVNLCVILFKEKTSKRREEIKIKGEEKKKKKREEKASAPGIIM